MKLNFKPKQDARVPLQVWVTQKGNGLVMEDGQSDGKLLLFEVYHHFTISSLSLF